ncbi:hypothetical protein TNCV_2030681 [Trichonephila clavipes]|nr:hypothetical protein TNCV_2030681 [Trichonephila clavipes]
MSSSFVANTACSYTQEFGATIRKDCYMSLAAQIQRFIVTLLTLWEDFRVKLSVPVKRAKKTHFLQLKEFERGPDHPDENCRLVDAPCYADQMDRLDCNVKLPGSGQLVDPTVTRSTIQERENQKT